MDAKIVLTLTFLAGNVFGHTLEVFDGSQQSESKIMSTYRSPSFQNSLPFSSFLSDEVDEVESEYPSSSNPISRRFFCLPPRVCRLPAPLPQPQPQLATVKPLCPSPSPSPICPENDFMDDIVLDIGPLTFILPREKMVSWLDAWTECKSRKGYTLASVQSVEKYTAVIQAIKKSGIKKARDFWTSGTDVFNLPRKASNFVWMSTQLPVELALPFWAHRQPDNAYDGQQCIALTNYFNKLEYKLDDQECFRLNYFICERMN